MRFGTFIDEVREALEDFETEQIDENQVGGDDDVDPETTLARFWSRLNERLREQA